MRAGQGAAVPASPLGMSMLGLGKHVVSAVNFDGTNDHLSRGADLTNLVDGKAGTMSVWTKIAGANGANLNLICNATTTSIRFQMLRASTNRWRLLGRNAANTAIMDASSNSSYTLGTGWLHVLWAWNLAATTVLLYVNDVSISLLATPTITDDTIDYVNGGFYVGASDVPANRYNGDVAELWFNASFIDITVESNRRKFISTLLKPADLGADGSYPTGSQPLLYLAGGLPGFITNKGSGGGFTEVGTLTASTTAPSD